MEKKNDKNGLMTSFVVGMDIIPEIVDAKQNDKNMKMVMEEWNLGPEEASEDPTANKEYWVKMARVWNITEPEARRQMCANCEYFQNSPVYMEAMEDIPMNKYDMDGGGRGYCKKFDFICHNLRTCQAWDKGHDY
jgi:hypothetical protein